MYHLSTHVHVRIARDQNVTASGVSNAELLQPVETCRVRGVVVCRLRRARRRQGSWDSERSGWRFGDVDHRFSPSGAGILSTLSQARGIPISPLFSFPLLGYWAGAERLREASRPAVQRLRTAARDR